MTLQSLKNRQTTARMLKRAIRTSTLMVLVSISSSAFGQAPINVSTGWHSATTALRPVPKFGSQIPNRTIRANAAQGSRQLNWRQSERVAPRRAAAHRPRPADNTDNSLESATVEPQLRSVRSAPSQIHQVNFQNADGEMLIAPPVQQPQRSRPNDFFSDPFGDDPVPTQAPANRTGEFFVPAFQGEEEILPPARPQPAAPVIPNQLRSSDEPPNRFDEPGQALPSPVQANPSNQLAPPEVIPTPAESQPPLERPAPNPPAAPEPIQNELPPRSVEPDLPDNEILPPARDGPEENPFDDFDFNDQARDRQDKDLLNEGDPDNDVGTSLDTNDLGKPEELNCGDFRARIAAATIDKVSLDISPPYRPDEIDIEKYEELKAEFDEKQRLRDWRTIDGSLLATGRLRDLAYEKAVIEVEPGNTKALQISDLSEGDLAYIAENWGLPPECRLEQSTPQPRDWAMMTMTWKASNLCHTPLYFEDVNLERYGHTRGPVLEPFVQSAHFFGNALVLPYKMGVHSPHECQYALGYYRPGNCAPWIKQPVPISLKGALTQGVTMAGLFWLIP